MGYQNDDDKCSMLALPSAMQESITEETSDILSNIAEIGLDAIMNDGFLREVPILSTAVSLFKIGNSLRERHYIKKLASFVFEFNNGMADDRTREYYKQKIMDDPQNRYKELEYILILIDRYLHANKPSLLAKLYLSYLDDFITWHDFTKYAEVVDRFLPGDCETLLSADNYKTERDKNTDSIQRLIALGLVIEGFRTMAEQKEDGAVYLDSPELIEKNERNYTRTEFGNTLVKIITEKM